MTKTPNGGFLVSGTKGVFKTDSSGSLLWDYSVFLGGAFSARQAVDGSVIVTGPGASGGTGDLFVVKIKSDDGSKSTENTTCFGNKTTTDNTTTSTWTKQLGTSSQDEGMGVTTDSSGNIYVTGYTKGDLDGNTSSGNRDIFLVKYNSSGAKQWTKQLGTSTFERGDKVTTDSSGNIYVTGYTDGDLDGNTSSGGSDIFLIKFNSSGTKIWTKQLGTSKDEEAFEVTIDSSGNIYISGYTEGGLDGNTNSGRSDIFLVKYNSSGTKQWTKQLGTSSVDKGRGVTTDSSDNIYVTGGTDGDLDGNTNSGSVDIFLVKYNSDGVKQ